MHSPPENDDNPLGQELAGRLESLATWVDEIDARLRAAELTTGDEKTAKELRRALEALAKHDPKLESRLTNRVDVLADRLATLGLTVSTSAASVAAKEGEIVSLRRELADGAERIQRLARDLGGAAGAAEVEELRSAVSALSAEHPKRTGDQRIDELGRKVDYFSERLDTLAKTVAATASGLAGREGDVAVLRQRLEESSTRVEHAVAELRRLQGESALMERLDSLENAVATTTSDLAERKRDITAVRARIDEAYARVGAVVSDLQRSIGALTSQVATLEQLPAATEQALLQHSVELNASIYALGGRLDSLSQSVESTTRELAGKELGLPDELQRLVAQLTERQNAAERERAAAASELTRNGEAWAEERIWVRAQLEAQAVAHAASSQSHATFGPLAETLMTRLDALEDDRGSVGTEVARIADALDVERASLRAQIAHLAAAFEQAAAAKTEPASSNDDETRRVLRELTGRFDAGERDREAATAEIGRAAALWASERSSLESRLDEVATQLVRVESNTRETRRAASSEDEVAQLRVLVDGLRLRLAASEQGLAAVAGASDVGARLDELSRRVDSAERLGPALVASSGGEPTAGEGRFRLELRALELRLEHAEDAARESREAVLVQLQRLASRIDWRLERLESEEAETVSETASGGAQVVPIRGAEV